MPPRKPRENPDETPALAQEPAPDDVTALLDTMGGTGTTVELHRVLSDGSTALVASIPGDGFDPFAVGQRFGAGKYRAVIKDNQRRYVGARTFQVEGPPPSLVAHTQADGRALISAAPWGGAPAQPPPSPFDRLTERLEAVLVAMQQRQQPQETFAERALLAMLTRDRAAPMGPQDVIGLVGALKGLSGNSQPLADLVAALKSLEEMRPESSGGEAPRGGGSDLGALVQLFAPLIAASQQHPPQAAPPTPAPPPHAPRPALPPGARPATAPPAQAAPPPTPTPPPAERAASDALSEALLALAQLLRLGAEADGDPDIYASVLADALPRFGIDPASPAFDPQLVSDTLIQSAPSLEPARRFVENVARAVPALYQDDQDDDAPAPGAPSPSAPPKSAQKG